MRKLFALLLLLALVGFTLPGCGGGGGGDSAPSQALQDLVVAGTPPPVAISPTDPDNTPGDPASVALTSSVPANTQLSQGGQALITAVVRDAGGKLVVDGTEVTFTASGGSITPSKVTASGVAIATFQAGSAGGTVTVTATAGAAPSKTVSIVVAAGAAASIIKESVTPDTIGIFGSGIDDTSQIKFSVRDSLGRVAADGTTVTFTIQTPLGGGEKLSAASATTAGGSVSVALKSGSVPGTVPVVASITTGTGEVITTVARVTIVSNRPDAGRITMAASPLNLAGGVTLGLQSTVTAYLGDRAGNVVPDGTPVSFITECGTIGQSTGFQTTTTFGVASGVLQTSAPTVPNLTGLGGTGNPGLCRVVAFTPGKGTYLDINGNGVFDNGIDVCNTPRMDEPFIDANDNGQYDAGEYYVDVNQNNSFDINVVNCVDDSMLWTSGNILISDHVGALNLTPTTFSIPIGGSQTFTVDVQDEWGNALVAGTTFEVTTTAGTLTGNTKFTQPDSPGLGQRVTFALLADTKADAEVKNAEIKVTIGAAPNANNNGATAFSFANGVINTPPPATAPTVVFTVPSNNQTNVALDAAISVVFSEPMNDLSVNNSSILLENVTDGGLVNLPAPAKVGNSGYTFTPAAPLLSGKQYRVTVTNQVFDSQNTQMVNPFIFTFTTR